MPRIRIRLPSAEILIVAAIIAGVTGYSVLASRATDPKTTSQKAVIWGKTGSYEGQWVQPGDGEPGFWAPVED